MADASLTFGATQYMGDQTGWAEQTANKRDTYERDFVLSRVGEEAASKLFDNKQEYDISMTANVNGSAPTIPATLGKLYSLGICTSMTITTTWNKHVDFSATCHNHTVNAHEDTLHQAAHGITVDDGFGATDFLGGTAGDNASVETSTCEITCEHEDKNKGNGDHLAGENYHGLITVTVTWNGTPTSTNDGSWDMVEDVTETSNVSFNQRVYRGVKKLVLS